MKFDADARFMPQRLKDLFAQGLMDYQGAPKVHGFYVTGDWRCAKQKLTGEYVNTRIFYQA